MTTLTSLHHSSTKQSLVERNHSSTALICHQGPLKDNVHFPSHLSILHLTHCNLKHFPENIFSLDTLVVLNLSHNEIQEIPTGILPNLEKVNLSNNLLKHVPPFISLAQELKEVNLSKNHIESIKGQTVVVHFAEKKFRMATFPKEIQCLNLQENKIQYLVLGKLSALIRLKIHGNPLKGRVSLSDFPHLQCLSLPFHLLNKFKLRKLKDLRKLEIYIAPSTSDEVLIATNLASTENCHISLKEET